MMIQRRGDAHQVCVDMEAEQMYLLAMRMTHLWNIVPQLNPTHVFASVGWEHLFPPEAQSNFSCVLQEFGRKHPGVTASLISHPALQGQGNAWNAKANLMCNETSVVDLVTVSTNVERASRVVLGQETCAVHLE
jgi:hypothetical protein